MRSTLQQCIYYSNYIKAGMKKYISKTSMYNMFTFITWRLISSPYDESYRKSMKECKVIALLLPYIVKYTLIRICTVLTDSIFLSRERTVDLPFAFTFSEKSGRQDYNNWI